MTPGISGRDAARGLREELARSRLRVQRGLNLLARRPPPHIGQTSKDEVWTLGRSTLWRYRSAGVRLGPPIMLYLGLVGDASIFDLHPGNSWAEQLLAAGFDVYLLDWGRPTEAEADHTMDTYLDGYFIHAVDAVLRVSGADEVALGAYCHGALMTLLLLGSRDDIPVRSLVLFTPPCDFTRNPDFIQAFRDARLDPADAIDETSGLVPEAAIRRMFRMLQPTSDLVQHVTLWENLWREDFVEAHRAVNHWAWNHRAISGAAFTQLIEQFVRGNAIMTGQARLSGRPVSLARITAPTMLVLAERDEFVLPASSEPLVELLGADEVELARIPGGHAGTLMGSAAQRQTMPAVVAWFTSHADSLTSEPAP